MKRRHGGAWSAILLALAVAACSPASPTTPGPITTSSIEAPASGTPAASPEGTAAPAEPTMGSPALGSPVEGVLLDIDSQGLADVTGFTLRLDDGRVVELRLGTLENGDEFPPGHLAEHLATSSPVRVFFRPVGGGLEVYRIEDAG